MPYLPSLPFGATLLDVFKRFPETNKPLIEFHEVLLRGLSHFSEAERELIAAYVSGLNRCRYCRASTRRQRSGSALNPDWLQNWSTETIWQQRPKR
jgi:alkylhydroperoxidase family enzyme